MQPSVLKALNKAHDHLPNLRLGQLLYVAMCSESLRKHDDMFYVDDDCLATIIDDFVTEKIRQKAEETKLKERKKGKK